MNVDHLRELLSQDEDLKLEFKREYHLNKIAPLGVNAEVWATLVRGQKAELTKDIIALTNGNYGTADQTAYLIIGVADARSPDGTRTLFDTQSLALNAQKILAIVNDACYPQLPDISCELIEIEGKSLTVVTIPPSPFVHETTRQLNTVSGYVDEGTGHLTLSKTRTYTERTAFVRRSDGIFPANAEDRRALAADKSPETFVIAAETLNVEEFLISVEERAKVKAIFVPPRNYRQMVDQFAKTGRLWIIGPSGLWKRNVAVSLALNDQVERDVYWIPRLVDWNLLAESGVSNSTLLFPDILGLNQYESQKIEGEFRTWDKLQENGNYIIATTSDEVFEDAKKETRLSEFLPKDQLIYLNEDSFDYAKKGSILERLVQFAKQQDIVSDQQESWVLDLLNPSRKHDKNVSENRSRSSAQLHKLLGELWLPVDVERFVLESLPDARSEEDLFDLLRGYADLEKRIHSWFLELDNSTRCFVLTLAILSGFEQKEIWSKHQTIVKDLKRLDPHLSIPPLGILREATRPYVNATGPLEFTNERVWRLVARELSKTYREYFTELIDTELLKTWSIPKLSDPLTEEDQFRIRDTENIRNAIARLTGEMAREGLDGVKDLLDAWAKQKPGRIGKTAGIALKEVAKDPITAYSALALLDEWSRDTSSAESYYRRWATASALGRILSIKSRFGTSEQALGILQRLADQENYVASAVPQAFQVMGSALPVDALSGVLTRLAKRDKFTQKEVSRALDYAAPQRLEAVIKLLDIWAALKSTDVRRTAILTLLTARKIPLRERSARLSKFFASEGNLVVTVLTEILDADDVYNRQIAIKTFVESASGSAQTRNQVVTILAAEYAKQPLETQQFLDKLQDESEFITDLQFEILGSTPYAAIKTLLFEPNVTRLPFLAYLLKEHYWTAVELIREALSTGSEDKLDWLQNPELIATTDDNPSLRLAAAVVSRRTQAIVELLNEVEQSTVEGLTLQLNTTREKAVEVEITNLADLDRSLVEIQSACQSKRYSDYLIAKQLAAQALAKAHSTCSEELSSLLKSKTSRLEILKEQKTRDTLKSRAVKYKAAQERFLLNVLNISGALVLTVALLVIIIEPTKSFTLNGDTKMTEATYDAGTSFEVLEESEGAICLKIEEAEKCYTRASLLPLGEMANSYSFGAIGLGIFIVVVIAVLAFVCWVFIEVRFKEVVKGQRSRSFVKEIQDEEEKLTRLVLMQDYFRSYADKSSTEQTPAPMVLERK